MAAAPEMAIEISPGGVRALTATASGETLRVDRVLAAVAPEDLDANDAPLVGAWIGARLLHARIHCLSALVALPRAEVGLRRLEMPSGDAETALLSAHRMLQCDRPPGAGEIRFGVQTVGRTPAGTALVAAALPTARWEAIEATLGACDVRVDRLVPAVLGVAALLDGREDRGRRLMAIDLSGDRAEISVLEHGAVRFSRPGPELEDSGDERSVEPIVAEAHRASMHYRITERAGEIDAAVVLGRSTLTAPVRARLADALGVEVRILRAHPRLIASEEALERTWPLAGLMLAARADRDLLDLAPARSAQRGARRRSRRTVATVVGMVLLAAVVVLAIGPLRTAFERRRAARGETTVHAPAQETITDEAEHAMTTAAPFPWSEWALSGVAESTDGPEAWLRNDDAGESRRLRVGETLGEAVLVHAEGEWAEFRIHEGVFRVRVGASFEDRTAGSE